MNELSNIVTSTGNYNNIPTSLTSNTSVVNLIEGLTLSKEADKINWSDGLLTYTIKLNNETNTPYTNAIITDVIDTSFIEFVDSSVKIDDRYALENEYSYDDNSNTLTINLNDIAENTEVVVTFNVKKK